MRKEKDALGEVAVPQDKYFGGQTQRARQNFAVGSHLFPRQWIRAHALVKKAAVRVHRSMNLLDNNLAAAIEQASDEIIGHRLDDHFPLVIWQSGSGTQFNMNVNEVIANRANELLGAALGTKSPVHPNDHVNMSQSTNDTVGTSMHIAAVIEIKENLLPGVSALTATLEQKSRAFAEIVKMGRTHLQDAVPLTLGQEFGGYAAQLRAAAATIESSLEQLYELPIGGTAVGTGLNAPVGFDEKMTAEIGNVTGYPFCPAPNKFAAIAAHDAVVTVSSTLKTLAVALMKIANDIRWLAGGPRGGLGELVLPANEPGSSIMPGKINPTQCEMVSMVVCRVFGNDTAVALAGAQGNFELNAYKPLLGYALLESLTLLADACRSFNDKCVTGIEPNRKQIERYLRDSLMLATVLNRHIGYDQTAEIALKAHREEKTLKAAALELGYLTAEQFDAWVRPRDMTKPT